VADTMVDESETTLDLPEELTELLADVVSFYFRAHGAHWNVRGSDFSEYHGLFNSIYEDVYSSIDPIAENLRKIGVLAPFRLSEFILLGTIEDKEVGQDPMALAADLLTANESVLGSIADAFECATNYNQQGIANFLAERMDKHQYWKWQLTVSLGQEVSPADMVVTESVEEIAEEAPMEMYLARKATGASDLPIADRGMAWDSVAADKRVRAWATEGTNMDWAKYGKAFFYFDTSKPEQFGAYKLQFADIVEGELKAVPRGIFAVAAVLNGDRGGVDLPDADRADIKSKVSAYYDRMANEFDDSQMQAPFERSEMLDFESRKSDIMSAERVTMDAEVRSISTTDGSLRIAGYAAQFNKEATGLSFREVIAPGAFKRSISSGDPIFLLVNHDTNGIPLASTASGTLSLTEDEVGLRMEANLDPNNPRAQELTSALSRGDISKMSFAFTVAPGGQTREEGLRTLTDLNLFEVSVVTFPAYDSTTVGMRSLSDIDDLELRRRKIALQMKLQGLK